MNFSDLKAIIFKEFLLVGRNRQLLLIGFILCAGYPPILCGVSLAMHQIITSAKPLNVAVLGDADFVRRGFAKENVQINIFRPKANTSGLLLKKKADAIITVPFGIETGNIRHDLKKSGSQKTESEIVPSIKIESPSDQQGVLTTAHLKETFTKIKEQLLADQLTSAHLSKPWVSRVTDKTVDAGTTHAGTNVYLTLPFVISLIVVAMSVAFTSDALNEERSQKTWQLLLVSAVDRNSLLYGKLLVSVSVVFLGLMVCLSSLLLCSNFLVTQGCDIGMNFTKNEAAVTALLALPLTIWVSSLMFLLCLCSRSVQEASIFQDISAFVLGLFPVISFMPSKFVAPALYMVPLVNVSLSIGEALQTGVDVRHFALTLVSSCLLGGLCLYGCTKAMNSESLLFNLHTPIELRKNHAAAVLTLCVFILFFYIGQVLMSWNIFWGTIATQTLFMVAPAFFWIKRRRLDVRQTMRLVDTQWYRFVGAALIAPGLTTAALGIAAVQNLILPTPSEFEKMMKATILVGHPLWQTIVAIAMTPGICEEILFRGAILGLLLTSMKANRAIAVSAFLFGLFHMSMFRFMPTFLAGAVLGIIAVTTGSIYPAMLLHAVHNMLSIWVSINEDHLEWWYLIAAATSTVFGAVLLGWFPQLSFSQKGRKNG